MKDFQSAIAGANFGGTSRAGSIPDCLIPSRGPVYLEGRLVLGLSFQELDSSWAITSDKHEEDELSLEGPLERYRIWDQLSQSWYPSNLELLRFDMEDRVVRRNAQPEALWTGAVDTQAAIILEPDLDEAGYEANLSCDLCWKRYAQA